MYHLTERKKSIVNCVKNIHIQGCKEKENQKTKEFIQIKRTFSLLISFLSMGPKFGKHTFFSYYQS
jgi:hypothetical protein